MEGLAHQAWQYSENLSRSFFAGNGVLERDRGGGLVGPEYGGLGWLLRGDARGWCSSSDERDGTGGEMGMFDLLGDDEEGGSS